MNRREFLELGLALGVGGANQACLGTPDSASLEPPRVLAKTLFDSLSGPAREAFIVPYDHPLRQYHNRGVSGGGSRVSSSLLDRRQLEIINRLFYAGLSEVGRTVMPRQFFLRWGGVRRLKLLLAGDPNTSDFQVIFTGAHLNFRIGGKSREGIAFGGPQVYGDQRGDERPGLPGNIYQSQFSQAREIFANLSSAERQHALAEVSPIQTRIELPADTRELVGLPVGDLPLPQRNRVRALVDSIFRPYRDEDVAYAWRCLDKNGSIDSMSLSFYKDGEIRGSGEYQIFRIEQTGAIFYFRGAPHVHAFINVGMDAKSPLSVGEPLGNNRAPIEGTRLKAFFETVLEKQTGADFGYYDAESAVGLIRSGSVRSGDLYTAESWMNRIALVTLKGVSLSGTASDSLRSAGLGADRKQYTIATTDYLGGELLSETFGRGARSELTTTLLRDASVDFAREHGFSTTPDRV